MAGENRQTAYALELFETLRRAPHAYHFFQALRRLECLYPEKPRLGKSLRVADDPVRLAQEPSLAFAPATLAAFDPGGA
ncbi:MAG: type VI secretion system baseplate subunit TssG, partial [Candidatus Competibacter sp.]